MSSIRPAFSIRPASASDSVSLSSLRAALFLEVGQHAPPGDMQVFEREATESFASVLERGQCLAWLAEAERARAIGSAVMLLFPRLPTPACLTRSEGYLVSVYTVLDWRRRGVSTALVAAALAKARELGLARIRLHATAAGAPVYSAAGFLRRDDEMELRF